MFVSFSIDSSFQSPPTFVISSHLPAFRSQMAPTLHQLPSVCNRPSRLFFSAELDSLPAVSARTGFTNQSFVAYRTERQTPMLDYCSPAKMDTGVVSTKTPTPIHCPSLPQERI